LDPTTSGVTIVGKHGGPHMFKSLRLLATGLAAGVVADRVWIELQKPSCDQFPWLRERMNSTINPWLLEHGLPGSAHAEIATLEHVGRTSGTTYFTPVHPTIRETTVLVPAPLGVGSQWAMNVRAAGHARMQFHEMLYELDEPELITVRETAMYPPQVSAPFDRMGWRYVRFNIVAMVPGTFATHRSALPALDGAPMKEPPLEGPYEIPVEPRMVEREPAPA
jgi:hypothetical protein